MNILRWDPFENFMNRPFPVGLDRDPQAAWVPAIDVFEKEDGLIIRAELPGVDRDQIHVDVDNGELVLSGERQKDEGIKEGSAYRLERAYGSFSRRFRLGDSLDTTKVTANYENGLLEISVPRSEKSRPRKIKINAA